LGRPGDLPRGLRASAGVPSRGTSVTTVRRNRYGVSFSTASGFSHGSRRSATTPRAKSSCAQAATISHVQRSACSGCLTFGRTHPNRSFRKRMACSMENLRQYDRQRSSRSGSSVPCHHSQSTFGPPAPLADRQSLHLDQYHGAPHNSRAFTSVSFGCAAVPDLEVWGLRPRRGRRRSRPHYGPATSGQSESGSRMCHQTPPS
jgi:hypothetical protein